MMAPASTERDRFLVIFERSLAQHGFRRLLLANYRGSETGLQRVNVRLIELRGQPSLSIVFEYGTRDVTKNLPLAEGIDALRGWLDGGFANAHLWTSDQEIQLAMSRKGRWSLRTGRRAAPADAAAAAPPAHNREKERMLSLDRPFLAALGVTDAAGRLIPAMARKWKQINRFLEVIDAAIDASPLSTQQHLGIVDFGSGKAYLSFALHDHLRHRRGIDDAVLTGVELRQELVDSCNGIAHRLGLDGLHFEQGDVGSAAPRRCDVLIALHACDTATDDAMHLGIRGGASIICCAPCCHKQLRPQLLAPHPLRPILQHGVHLGQEAEMLTDGLRALLLEACGYDTQVFEFVSLEHTAKNKMILAVKRARPEPRAEVLDQVREIRSFYGIREQRLEALLAAGALISPPAS